MSAVIAEVVTERLPDVHIIRLLDGAILFETQCSYDTLNFFCFNNIFAAIDVMECGNAEHAPETHIQAVITGRAAGMADGMTAAEIMAHNSKKFRTFRVVISRENRPAAIDERLRVEAERYIARISGLGVNRSRPDAEFWFLYRREGISLFMKRLTLRPSWEKSLHPGELPPPLAWTLCRLARLRAGDAVLDPFCGYGAIPAAAIHYFHITKCIACDNDQQAVSYSAARFKKRAGGSCALYRADFRSLAETLPARSIDAVVTDPPWGLYGGTGGVARLYDDMFGVFTAVVKERGRVVVLCAIKEALLAAAAPRHFQLQTEIPILLSGKKTHIMMFTAAAL